MEGKGTMVNVGGTMKNNKNFGLDFQIFRWVGLLSFKPTCTPLSMVNHFSFPLPYLIHPPGHAIHQSPWDNSSSKLSPCLVHAPSQLPKGGGLSMQNLYVKQGPKILNGTEVWLIEGQSNITSTPMSFV